jgi:hypothetical protein
VGGLRTANREARKEREGLTGFFFVQLLPTFLGEDVYI